MSSQDVPYIDPIAEQLRDYRLDQGVMQKDAAAQIGFSSSVLSTYENGRVSPQLWQLRQWADWADKDLRLADVKDAGRTRTPSATATSDNRVVRLTRYQIALAAGMLLAASRNGDSGGRVSADLMEISNALIGSL